LTQREVGRLVQVKAEYRAEPEWLCLRFPDGAMLEGPLTLGEAVITRIWGRQVAGHAVTGDWSRALSDFCQQPVRLMRSDQPGQCYDEFPVSLLSQASLQALSRQPEAIVVFDSRRFRPNFLLDGCEAHEEDTWLGGAVQIGESARLRVVSPDPRCAITTHNPETGEGDVDTPSLIKSYRPSAGAAYFGVYALVERPGPVSVGDMVTV
jgi:uncharacterized protein YcbX